MSAAAEVELSPEQARCLARGAHVSVSAGAGSGKTRVLVRRYLALVGVAGEPAGARVYDPEEIVAITFTRKAAAEIKERLRQRLLAIWDGEDPVRAARAGEVLEVLGRARIGTIDSFLADLLREHPLEAGVEGDFAILDEQQRRWLEEEALAEVFRRVAAAAEAGEPDPLVDAMRVALRASGGRFVLEGRARALLRDRDLLAGVVAKGAAGLLEEWEALRAADRRAVAAEVLAAAAAADLPDRLRDLAASGQPGDTLRSEMDAVVAALAAVASGDDGPLATLADLALTADGKPRSFGRKGKKTCWETGGLEEARAAMGELAEALGAFPLLKELDEDPARAAAVAEAAAALAAVASEVAARYRELAARIGALDFQDLLAGARRLVSGPGAAARRARLRERFPVFLLDEMQDTNAAQWEVLRALALGAPDEDAGTEAFLVGDPKQAIYSFRRADVRAFLRAQAELAAANADRGAAAGAVELSTNYRSAPAILRFVNGLFAPLLAEPDAGFEVPFQELAPGLAEAEGRVGVLLVPPEDPADPRGGIPRAVREAELVAAGIARVLRQGRARPGEVAILLRRRAPLREIEGALRRAGIPYRVWGGVGFYQRQEVRDLVSLLRVLADRRDDLALAAVLRSPFFGVTDEGLFHLALVSEGSTLGEKLAALAGAGPGWDLGGPEPAPPTRAALVQAHAFLEGWRALAGRLPAAALLRRAAADAGLWGALAAHPEGGRAAENVAKLLDQVRGVRGGVGEVARFFSRLVADEHGEGEAAEPAAGDDAVRIMTVHAAKGLEFPVVFVPDLARVIQGRSDGGLVVDPDGSLAFPTPRGLDEGGKAKPCYATRRARDRRTAQERAEEKRLFYVACTRAARELWLVGSVDDWAPVKPGRKGTGKSWLDWLRVHLPLDETALEDGEVEAFGGVVEVGGEDPGPREAAPVAPAPARPGLLAYLGEPPAPGQAAPEEARRALARHQVVVPPATLSPSKLMDLGCPRFYYHRHVLGLDPTERARLLGRRARPVGGAGTLLGTAVHRGLEGWAGGRGPGVRAGLDAFLAEHPDLPDASRAELDAAASAMCEEFLASSLARDIEGARKVLVEEGFSVALGGTTLVGSIDMLYQAEDRSWTVVDWKTNRPPPDEPVELWTGRMMDRYRPQLLAYTLALRERRALRPSFGAALYFLRTGVLRKAEITDDDLDAFRDRVEEDVRGIAEGRLGRADAREEVDAARCRRCAFRRTCPETLAP